MHYPVGVSSGLDYSRKHHLTHARIGRRDGASTSIRLFPELAALVSVVQSKIDDVNMAGLWKTDMSRDLAWVSYGKDLGTAVLHDYDRYIAPAQVLDVQLELAGPEALGQLSGALSGAHVEIDARLWRHPDPSP
ncbi:hypothetical protein GJ744_003997 [Endocarpon pusillum]|uniref:Uncharacterized protein n=1 Tax=Endocarpon pusillum TaxID=364733 RepID=A0A8H7AA03_9EURO|nr:hypothetical protein GJ744_003997 [Endocarpon pusillum]